MKSAKELLTENNLHESHWGQRIIQAEDAGHFTEEDEKAAGNWFSCACGKLDDHIKRGDDGTPADEELEILGCHFDSYVAGDDFLNAAFCLIQIECRSASLLMQTQNR